MLVAAAEAVGLDGDAARDVLSSGRYADEVRDAEEKWQEAGITGVPAVVINDRYLPHRRPAARGVRGGHSQGRSRARLTLRP